MTKYKISITKTYTVDVLADTQKEAEVMAEVHLDACMLKGTEHYLQTSDTNFVAYEVEGTDDGEDGNFNPVNK